MIKRENLEQEAKAATMRLAAEFAESLPMLSLDSFGVLAYMRGYAAGYGAATTVSNTLHALPDLPLFKSQAGATQEDVANAAALASRLGTSYLCPICGQHITDGKPCGCGARQAEVDAFAVARPIAQTQAEVDAFEEAAIDAEIAKRDLGPEFGI